MNPLALLAALSAASCALAACSAREQWDPRELGDLMPPVLAAVVPLDSRTVEARFDEPVSLVPDTLLFDPPEQAPSALSSGTSLLVTTATQRPGTEYRMEATVEDAAGNSSSVVARFYGYNGRVPRLLISEFITRGSGNHPDLVELRVLSDGDLAGVVLLQGSSSDWVDRIVFPSCEVRSGELLLVHWRPQGLEVELDETGPRDASGGLDAAPGARDFWVRGAQGLGGNNGTLTLYDRPGGELLDAVLYSNRTSDSDAAYGGFGSASMLARAREVVAQGGWIASEEGVRPEDAVSPEGSTATRSIARMSSGVDTNASADWHITPTRGASWGGANTDERYEPPAGAATADP